MAKLCPIINEKVVYLQCLECDEKPCKEKNIVKADGKEKEAPVKENKE